MCIWRYERSRMRREECGLSAVIARSSCDEAIQNVSAHAICCFVQLSDAYVIVRFHIGLSKVMSLLHHVRFFLRCGPRDFTIARSIIARIDR